MDYITPFQNIVDLLWCEVCCDVFLLIIRDNWFGLQYFCLSWGRLMTGHHNSISFVMRHLLPWFSSYRANIAVRTNQTPPLGCLHLHVDIKWTFLVQMVRKRRKSKRNTLTSLTLQLSIKASNSLLVPIMLEITGSQSNMQTGYKRRT